MRSDGWTPLASMNLRSPWTVEVVAQAAASLGRWHQTTQQSSTAFGPTTPWLVATIRESAETPFVQQSRAHVLLGELLADASLRPALEHLADVWQQSHLLHGNLQLDKVMVHVDGSIRFVDLEASGWGDPRWDLATLVQELRSFELQSGVDTATHRSATLQSYAEWATSPTPLHPDDPTLQAFVVGRLVVNALRLTNQADDDDDLVEKHLNAARSVHIGGL